jgi:hypothetical protein
MFASREEIIANTALMHHQLSQDVDLQRTIYIDDFTQEHTCFRLQLVTPFTKEIMMYDEVVDRELSQLVSISELFLTTPMTTYYPMDSTRTKCSVSMVTDDGSFIDRHGIDFEHIGMGIFNSISELVDEVKRIVAMSSDLTIADQVAMDVE